MLPHISTRFVILFPLLTCLLMLPSLQGILRRLPDMAHVVVVLYATPQAAALTLPIALFIAVVLHVVAIAKPVRAQLIRGMLPIALSCGIASLVLTMWIVPASNQAFRVTIYNVMLPTPMVFRDLLKGMNERSWTELRQVSVTGTMEEAERARAAIRTRYSLAIVTFLSGLIAVYFGVLIRPLRPKHGQTEGWHSRSSREARAKADEHGQTEKVWPSRSSRKVCLRT